MKSTWSIFTQTGLTLTLLASAAIPANAAEAKYDADLYLDTLDADGHLSLLDAQVKEAESNAQKVTAEPQVAVTKTEKTKVAEAKAETKAKATATEVKYVETKYSSKAADTYGKDHSSDETHTEIAAAPKTKANAHGKDHDASSAKKGFLSKHTTEIEFTFAILVIVVGLIASERFQRAHEQQMQMTNESSNNDLGQWEDS